MESSDGALWVGTGAGLVRMKSDEPPTHFHHDPADASTICRGGVRAILEDSKRRLWVGTELGGLCRYDGEAGTFSRFDRSSGAIGDNYVRKIIEVDGSLWIATFNGGVYVFDPETGRSEHVESGPAADQLASSRVRSLLKDRRGDIWVGTDAGLHLWHPETGHFTRYAHDPTDVHSLGNNLVFELFEDGGGVIWVGTYNGVSKWNASIGTFPHFRRGNDGAIDLASDSVTSFAETDSAIWIGTLGGLSKWSKLTGEYELSMQSIDGLSDDTVMSLASHGNEIWAGTISSGVNVIRGDRVVEHHSHDPLDTNSVSANAITSIMVDQRGDTWLSTYGGGVNRYLGEGRFQRFPADQSPEKQFASLRAIDIAQAPDGRLWIATDGGGVVVLDPDSGATEIIRHVPGDPASLSGDNVITVAFARGTMWVGARDSGLNRYAPESGGFIHYSKADGLASDAVYGILEDADGRLWISGGQGLSMLNADTDEFTSYDTTHGLQSNDFSSGSSLKLADGSLLFGGDNGFNAFDPNQISRNTYVPPIVITEFTKFNEPFSLPTPIHNSRDLALNYDDFVIGFEFAAMDYTAPEKNRYQYMLSGFDRDWVDAKSGTNQVTYTNLDSGSYTFRIRGSNNDGVWNEEGASVNLVVKPPPWETWWAYLVYLGLGIGVLYQAQKANERRLRREAEKRYSERLQLYIESLEEATDCVLIADANKNLMYANNATTSILGCRPTDAVGGPIFTLLFNDPVDAERARHGLKMEGRWHGEVPMTHGTQTITTEVTIAAVRDESENETAYVAIARDITDRKRTQAELENHRRNLEFLVAERTKALEREIAENKAFQKELANSLEEKELLLKEVHHRVKNNMQVISSLLNIQSETIGNEEYANLLGESQQRIKSMSLIHENLYQSDNLLEIDFEDYIRMLANSLCRFYTIPGVSVNMDIHVEDVNLDIETAVPCGLIINELISNSLKHAFIDREGTATISVVFRHSGCQYVLQISDDGIGLPDDFDPSKSSSMGMEIISILTQQLDGCLHIDGNDGAAFEIAFPRKEKSHVH
jgi:PAS domain S-box-containing protein